jgi:hypothetical protein
MTGKGRNSFGIRYPNGGPPRLVDTLRGILDALDALRIQQSAEIFSSVTATGTTLTLRRAVAGPRGGGASAGPYPFDVELIPVDEDEQTAIVRPGTINGLLATNYLDTFPLDPENVYYLVANITTADGEITAYTLSFDSSAPAGIPTAVGLPPTSFTYLLGIVNLTTWFRTIGLGSLVATSVEAFRVSKTSPAPGTLPYEIWYTWQLGV